MAQPESSLVPGSWHYLRPVRDNEVRKTTVLAFLPPHLQR